jgi:polyhydroxybutyrate depolymerase
MIRYFHSTLFFAILAQYSYAQKNIDETIIINNTMREYTIHLPKKYKSNKAVPLLLIFHGGGGTRKHMQRYMGMDEIADKENFITVYPSGIGKQWNDGREFNEEISSNNDVIFVSRLLDKLIDKYAIDTQRIFSTGISNGGFFSIYLSYKLSGKFLAVAPVCATIPEKIYKQFYPSFPVSILLINGTKDPLVPYFGGEVGNSLAGSRGRCMSTDSTIKRYLKINRISSKATIKEFADVYKEDGCKAVRYAYTSADNTSQVILVKVIQGGHTLPGGSQYLPKFVIGRVCRDFMGNEIIWEFFRQCKPRQADIKQNDFANQAKPDAIL